MGKAWWPLQVRSAFYANDNLFYGTSIFEWPPLSDPQKGFLLLCQSLFLRYTLLHRLADPRELCRSLLIVEQFLQMALDLREAADRKLY